jgi:hypothetical protein
MTAVLLLVPSEFVGYFAIGVEELNHRIAFGINAQHHGQVLWSRFHFSGRYSDLRYTYD